MGHSMRLELTHVGLLHEWVRISLGAIHMVLCQIEAKNLMNYLMFFDESKKLETYTHVRTK